jgi:hypothetical protein
MIVIGKGNVGADVLTFERHNVVGRAILGIPSYVPTKMRGLTEAMEALASTLVASMYSSLPQTSPACWHSSSSFIA